MQPTVVNRPSSVPSPSNSPRRRPLDELHAEIVELATQLTAACSRLTRLIGEFDAAEGWGEWGMRSTAHWLSWVRHPRVRGLPRVDGPSRDRCTDREARARLPAGRRAKANRPGKR